MDIRLNEIYRHISGSFYTVIAVSNLFMDDVNKDIIVLKKLSEKSEVVTYFLEDFVAEAEDEVANILGQKYLFVRVKDACNSLAETPTEALVSELKTRLDNPYAEKGDPKVYDVSYEVGTYKPVPPKHAQYVGQAYFEPVVSKDTLKDAIQFVKTHWSNSRRPVIMRVTKAEEKTFD